MCKHSFPAPLLWAVKPAARCPLGHGLIQGLLGKGHAFQLMWSPTTFSSQRAVGRRELFLAGCQQDLAMCPPPLKPLQQLTIGQVAPSKARRTHVQAQVHQSQSQTPFFNRLHHLLLLEDHPRSSPLKKGPHKPTDAGHRRQGDHLKVCPPHFQALSVIHEDYFLCYFFFFNDLGYLYLNILTYTHHTHTFPAVSRVDQIIYSSPSQPRLTPNIMY